MPERTRRVVILLGLTTMLLGLIGAAAEAFKMLVCWPTTPWLFFSWGGLCFAGQYLVTTALR